MPTDRSGKRTVRSRSSATAPKPRPGGVGLAPGVRLDKGKEQHSPLVLLGPEGKVHLNKGAAAILRLCDGSRNRETIVAEVVRRTRGTTLASDIREFLDAARARGWIVEP
jgi:pyrroloquinoline quinone biosynthesis protein D